MEPRVEDLAAQLGSALDDELRVVPRQEDEPRTLEPRAPEPRAPEPRTPEVRREPAFGAPQDETPADEADATDEAEAAEDEPHETDEGTAADEATLGAPSPRVGGRRRHNKGEVGNGDLAVAPGRERAGPARETATPPRGRRVVVAERRETSSSRELTTRPRRSKAKSLTSTAIFALILIVVVGGVAWWLDRTGVANFGLRERIASTVGGGQSRLEVLAGDGWVNVPQSTGTVVVSADGPYRVRLNGEVFSLGSGEALQVPMGETTQLSVRAVRAPTVARVAPLP
ncbi:hypothetical protein L1787_24215 [Acuticoccus sp. M5D2P5]|uniref:hypothetical protein n=1 Tax=Acuticoccus kalidii TaxID=2910977 RepID=UPI001F380892|nr:hypothetical protein [Acuticoccus kalidii]MCF3936500.1 hypothetical protein [Acuticoccus kalidii]